MIIPIINTEERELTVGFVCHITSWYVNFALPLAIDFSWQDINGQKCFDLNIDILCFRFYIEYWKWNTKNEKTE